MTMKEFNKEDSLHSLLLPLPEKPLNYQSRPDARYAPLLCKLYVSTKRLTN